MPGAHEVVGPGLARRIRRVGRVRSVLTEPAIGAERTVHLVCRHVQESKGGGRRAVERSPVAEALLQQRERTDDVGLDERRRPVDRPVDVRFGGEMDDGAGAVPIEAIADGEDVADVDVLEVVPRVVGGGAERLEVTGVGELVDVHDAVIRVAEQHSDERGANEAGAAGDQPGCHRAPRYAPSRASARAESRPEIYEMPALVVDAGDSIHAYSFANAPTAIALALAQSPRAAEIAKRTARVG